MPGVYGRREDEKSALPSQGTSAGSLHRKTSSIVHFYLFGRFQAFCDGREIPGFQRRAVRDVIAYVLISKQRFHHREKLAETLWGEGNSDPRRSLRQALWWLRAAEKRLELEAPLLLVEAEWISLSPNPPVWADLWDVVEAFGRVRRSSGEDLPDAEAMMLERVVNLYRGDFLEGCYGDWCLSKRDQLRSIFVGLLAKLASYFEARNWIEEGLLYTQRVLEVDPADELAHRRLMRLYWMAGDRVRALRHFQRCEEALMREVGVEPSSQTIGLFRQISDGSAMLGDRSGIS